MLPKNAKDLAIVRMVELVTINELGPTLYPLSSEKMGWGIPEAQEIAKAKEKVDSVLTFFEGLLDDSLRDSSASRPFFGSNTLTYAECVAGTVVPLLSWVGVSVDGYHKIQAWCDRLLTRPSWQKTQFTQADLAAFFSRRQKFLEQSQAS